MGKYTTEELQEMAKQFLQRMALGDARCDMTIMMLSAATGVTPEQCMQNIDKLSKGETV